MSSTTNSLRMGGVDLDLDEATVILPSFQVSDLLKPESIQSDFSPEFTVPATARNHQVLGQAAYDGSPARVPYKSLPDATLLSQGVEIMPRARLFVKGYDEGRYQLQLFAGNRRFVEALGERSLRDLDFARFNHRLTLDDIAARASASYRLTQGWSYELFDQGKPLAFESVSPYDLRPTLSASLVWRQILTEAGSTASDFPSALLERLQVPSVAKATRSEAFRTARQLRVGINGIEVAGNPSANRDSIERIIPFNDYTRPIGTVPPLVPTVPGMYNSDYYSWKADATMYITVEARTVVFLDVSYAKASAQVFIKVNGEEVAGGEKMVKPRGEHTFSVATTATKLLVQAGDVVTATVKLKGEEPLLIGGTKWGFSVFRDTVFRIGGVSIPVDRFSITVEEEIPPGGIVQLADWLPDVKLLDFFKTLVQLGGLTVQCDPYDDHLHLFASQAVLARAPQARDWTRRRDAPADRPGAARRVAYRLGSFAQRNHFRYAEDETVAPGTGDGVLLVDNVTLPSDGDLLTLPFAASEPSKVVAGLLFIPAYELRENEAPFAEPEYDAVTVQPRLTLHSDRTLLLTLVEDDEQRAVTVAVSHFADPDEPVSLDAQTYVLPTHWRGLQAVLTDCRAHTERYRLSVAELADFVADPTRPVWDGVLQGYFAVSLIGEYSATRPVEVELARLHPDFLPASVIAENGLEFYTPVEFDGSDFY